MTNLVYKRVRNHRWTDAWERLAPAERETFLAKLDEVSKMSGDKRYSLLAYDTAAALQEWSTFGIEIFPDIPALQRHEKLLDQLNFTKYVPNGRDHGRRTRLTWVNPVRE